MTIKGGCQAELLIGWTSPPLCRPCGARPDLNVILITKVLKNF